MRTAALLSLRDFPQSHFVYKDREDYESKNLNRFTQLTYSGNGYESGFLIGKPSGNTSINWQALANSSMLLEKSPEDIITLLRAKE